MYILTELYFNLVKEKELEGIVKKPDRQLHLDKYKALEKLQVPKRKEPELER